MMMMTEHAVRKLLCLRASVGVEPACVWYSVQKASHAPCVRPRADLRHAGSSVGERERERLCGNRAEYPTLQPACGCSHWWPDTTGSLDKIKAFAFRRVLKINHLNLLHFFTEWWQVRVIWCRFPQSNNNLLKSTHNKQYKIRKINVIYDF